MFDFVNSIHNFVGDQLGNANPDANDAAAHSQDHPLLSLPPSYGTSPASNNHIDLTSPPHRPREATQGEPNPHPARTPPLPPRPRISDDERHLVADYSTPADAVAAPDPRSWFPSNTNPAPKAMTIKPGSTGSYRPINTINDVNPGARGARTITYSKQHRTIGLPTGQTRLPIGQAQHAGQMTYSARYNTRVPSSPTRDYASIDEHTRSSRGASPPKRRKTTHVIDLESDESNAVHDTRPPLAPHTPATASPGCPPSTRSSQSQPSNGSGSTLSGNKKASQAKSEFQEVDSIASPYRKKAREPNSSKNQVSSRLSPFGGGSVASSLKAHAATAPIVIFDEENMIKAPSTRRLILEEFQQGRPDHAERERNQPLPTRDSTTSHHFANARINESTSDQVLDSGIPPSNGADMRTRHKRAPNKRTDHSDGSGVDELALSDTDRASSKRKKVPSKARQAANSGVKRRITNGPASIGWPLVSARTYGYEGRGSRMANGDFDLILRNDANGFRVVAYDYDKEITITKIQIQSRDVNKVTTDNLSRMRLEGPRRQDGIPVFDLEFIRQTDLVTFRDLHVLKSLARRLFTKTEDTMSMLFSKPLLTFERVGTTLLVDDFPLGADEPSERVHKMSQIPMWDQLRSAGLQSSRIIALRKANGSASETPIPRTSARPSRTTRSSNPTYDLPGQIEDGRVYKHSVDHGLGDPWAKPLEYGSGRQRAVVHFDDLPRLDDEEFMNDSLIDFYIIYLFDKSNIPSDKVYFFNTYFFTQLTKNTGRHSMNYQAVERWTSKVDIFNYDYIVVPINEQTHWYLAIICNVSKIDRKPVQEDFDEDLQRAPAKSPEKLINHVAHEQEPTTCPAPTSSISVNAMGVVSEQIGDDPILFEEELGLNLIDPDDPGGEHAPDRTNEEVVEVPRSTPTETRSVALVVADLESIPTGIFRNLSASPARRKTRRKITQPKKDPDQPIVLILDSLGQTRSGTVRALKDWLAAEGNAKRGMEALIKENGYYPKASQIPMQNNWSDCGVYLLGYVDKFFQNPDEFKNKLLTGEMSAQEDWPELKPKDMRNNMRNIIVQFAAEQEATRKESKKAKKEAAKIKTLQGPVETGSLSSKSGATQTVQLSAESDGMQSKPVVVQDKPLEESALGMADALIPRLGSPFSFEQQRSESSNRLQSSQEVAKVSDSPPLAISSINPTSISVKSERTPRRVAREVRIPAKSPGPQFSTRNTPTDLTLATQPGNHIPQPESAHQLRSRNKRQIDEEGDDRIKPPIAKRRSTRSPEQSMNGPAGQPSPLVPHHRDGSETQPITIEDSQEINVMADVFPESTQTSPQRGPPTKLLQNVPALGHAPSIEQIARPAAFAKVERKHRRIEEVIVGHELEARLNEADQEQDRKRRSEQRSPTTFVSQSSSRPAEESDFDPMDVDTTDVEVMEIDESTHGSEVGETPESNRRSPDMVSEWTVGQPLPI